MYAIRQSNTNIVISGSSYYVENVDYNACSKRRGSLNVSKDSKEEALNYSLTYNKCHFCQMAR